MAPHLQKLVESARSVRMTETETYEQRISFAFGTANIENEDVTRDMVEAAAKRMESAK